MAHQKAIDEARIFPLQSMRYCIEWWLWGKLPVNEEWLFLEVVANAGGCVVKPKDAEENSEDGRWKP